MDKSGIRALLRNSRKKIMATPAYTALSDQLQGHLLAAQVWKDSSVVVLYHAINGEVKTNLLLKAAWAEHKQVYLPRCRPESPGEMDMLACASSDELVLSDRRIPEPPPEAAPLTDAELAHALIVVPALGYDLQGYRVGYGGGYYDRMLARPHGPAVGLAFRSHVLSALPHDAWDMPVNALCTEEGLLWI